jgi:esterase/lipase superfamily enzyme
MGRNVHLWQYGFFGPPVVVFPSAAGFAHEWQAQGMIDVLKPLLAAGRMKLYCPESNVAEAWTKKDQPLGFRMQRHAAYERWVMDVLVPHIREDCRWSEAPITAVGCSLGGLYAALFALKQPEVFTGAVCMSGRYLATALTDGEIHPELYFNSPLHFVPGLDGAPLDRVKRHTHITLVCGQGMWEEGCIEETIALGDVFRRKGIPHERDIWGRESRHDWDWWMKQAVHHLGRRFAR